MNDAQARDLLKKHARTYGDRFYEPAEWVIAAMKEASATESAQPAAATPRADIVRFNPVPGLGMNPHHRGLYVFYEDHAAALTAALAAPAAPQDGEDAPASAALGIRLDRVLSIADVHAEESREDGIRLFDRGGLLAFAKDVLRVATQDGEYARTVAWVDAQKVTDIPAVDEALEAFSHDSTWDNAVAVVQSVLTAQGAAHGLEGSPLREGEVK